MNKNKTLHLSLHKKAFEVMKTGEKLSEYRKYSSWIASRLFNADFSKKEYDYIKFTNGYGKDRPCFLARYKGFKIATFKRTLEFSNGLTVDVEIGDYIIDFKLINP